jgi:LuxR family transcriptional regulator, maltose regulon positive regulatory protein
VATVEGGRVTGQRAAEWGAIGTRLVERGELLAALDRAVTRKVTVISAPAGSGKTFLLRAWADRPVQTYPVAFVTVRRGQRDEQLFWLALLLAIQATLHDRDADEPLIATPGFNAEAMVDRVLSHLADYPGRVVLVLDDLHELESAGVESHLTRLLTELPTQAHAVLATRRDLRLGLHQLRLAGELAEIRAADLRFTEAETRQMLATSGVVLSDEAVATLRKRTEGWAAGIRLAAISLAEHPDPERFVAEFSGSNRTVADYLIGELLERQPAHVQELLLRTSVLDWVNGELADLMTGYSGSEQLLLELEDANVFVVSLDPERTWFRYHQLFGELLRLELRRTMASEVPQLHRLAAKWFAEHDEPIDAIRHTQAAGDWPNAARLLADHSLGLTLDGHSGTIQALLQAFPRGLDADDAELALVYATQDLVQGRLDEAAAHLELAEQRIMTAPAERQHRLRVAIAILELELATRRGHFTAVVEQVRFLCAPLATESTGDVAVDSDLRAFALLNLGIVESWSLNLADAERHLLDGATLARTIGRSYLEVACLARLGFASKRHSFARSRARSEEAIAIADRQGWGSDTVVAPALASLGGTLVWTGEADEGEVWLERAAKASHADAEPGTKLLLHLATGMLHVSRGERHAALEELSAAERMQALMIGEHALSAQVSGWAISTKARVGMLDEARASLAGLPAERARSGEICNACAVLHLAEGNPAAALTALGPVLEGHAPVIYAFTLVEAHLLAARAHVELGDRRAATAAIERALALAEPDRLIFPFVMTGSGDLLEALPRHETAHAALLIDILDVLRGSGVRSSERPPAPPMQELTETELRVLRFLPTNLSRQEIARELYLSVNTVNTHVRNIYAKLDARDRSAAVERARELRLLSGPASH